VAARYRRPTIDCTQRRADLGNPALLNAGRFASQTTLVGAAVRQAWTDH
jgi:hypothetical protein